MILPQIMIGTSLLHLFVGMIIQEVQLFVVVVVDDTSVDCFANSYLSL